MIETARLILRPWKEEDLAPYSAMNADPRVREFFPGILTREQSDAELRRRQQTYTRDGFCFFAAEVRDTGDFAGFVGIQTMRFAVPNVKQLAVEIGWRLAHSYWGKGYATEGASAIMDRAWRVWSLTQVVAITVPANQRSRHVMEKLGMEHHPELDFDHPNMAEGHPLRRHVLYVSRKP